MKKLTKVLGVALFVSVLAAASFNASQAIARPLGGGCNKGTFCPDVYAPVICSNGQVYSNSCYAGKACATGCRPYGLD